MKRLLQAIGLTCLLLLGGAAFFITRSETHSDITTHLFSDIVKAQQDQVLFIGSSSVKRLQGTLLDCRNWLNRGIGSATLTDLHRYVAFATLRQDFSHIIIYAGENDLAVETTTEDLVLRAYADYQSLVARLHKRWPTASIEILALKLSPTRHAQQPSFIMLNQALQDWAAQVPYLSFKNHLLASQLNSTHFYLADGIHLNNLGYAELLKGLKAPCERQW